MLASHGAYQSRLAGEEVGVSSRDRKPRIASSAIASNIPTSGGGSLSLSGTCTMTCIGSLAAFPCQEDTTGPTEGLGGRKFKLRHYPLHRVRPQGRDAAGSRMEERRRRMGAVPG